MTLAFAFSSPLHTYIEEMRCNILCGCKKKASQQLRHGFLYPRALLLLLDPRAQMKPPLPPFNLCADERISPGLSTNSVNKSQGDPKKS
jgi:hypothetical protein